jgi:DNA-binding response OmpR family regulator
MRTALIAYNVSVFQSAIMQALTIRGFKVHGAADQNALLALHAQLEPTLVVINQHLPPFGAREAIRAVRGFDRNRSKIIAITPDIEPSVIRGLHEVGADEVITGGYSLSALNTKLKLLGIQ